MNDDQRDSSLAVLLVLALAILIVLSRLRREDDREIVYEPGPNNWTAFVPSLPGCVASGATRDEVEKNIHEAIAFHLEGLAEDGITPPPPSPRLILPLDWPRDASMPPLWRRSS